MMERRVERNTTARSSHVVVSSLAILLQYILIDSHMIGNQLYCHIKIHGVAEETARNFLHRDIIRLSNNLRKLTLRLIINQPNRYIFCVRCERMLNVVMISIIV